MTRALRWAVVVVDLDPTRGSEQAGERRALVVSYEAFHRSQRITVCPITAARDEVRYPNEVLIPAGHAGQTKSGVILCHQVRTIALERVVPPLKGYVTDPSIRTEVRSALQRQLGLDIPEEADGAK